MRCSILAVIFLLTISIVSSLVVFPSATYEATNAAIVYGMGSSTPEGGGLANPTIYGIPQPDIGGYSYDVAITQSEADYIVLDGADTYHPYLLHLANEEDVIPFSQLMISSDVSVVSGYFVPLTNPSDVYETIEIANCTTDENDTETCFPYNETYYAGTSYDEGEATDTINASLTLDWKLMLKVPYGQTGHFNLSFTANGAEQFIDPDISSGPYIINSSGTYDVLNSITVNGVSAITINASNVTLDCHGFSLTGNNTTTTYGVYSTKTNSTVRNCVISNFTHGIYFVGSKFSNIINTTTSTTKTGGAGIYIYNAANYISIINSSGTGTSSEGIRIMLSNYANIYNTTGISTANGFGFYFNVAANSSIANSNATSDSGTALFIEGGTNVSVINLTTRSTTNLGVRLSNTADKNLIANTLIYGKNPTYGALNLYGSSNNTIVNNTINGLNGSATLGMSVGINLENIFINNTLLNATNLLYLGSPSSNNVFCLNNFTDVSGYYVRDLSGANYFNCTFDGANQGNIWFNVINNSVQINGSATSSIPGLYIGDSGSGYPYSNNTSLGKILNPNVIDFAPLTSTFLPSNYANITAISIAPTNPTTASNLSCNITGQTSDEATMLGNYTWYKNGINQSANISFNISNNTATLFGNITGLVAGDNWSCSAVVWSSTSISAINYSANVTVQSVSATSNLTVINGTGSATNFSIPANLSINASTITNYTFNNWSVTSGNCTITNILIATTFAEFLNTTSACTVQANFVYTPSVNGTSNLTVLNGTGSATNFPIPANRSIVANTIANYTFANWSVELGNCTITNTTNNATFAEFLNTTSPCTVQANFNYTPVVPPAISVVLVYPTNNTYFLKQCSFLTTANVSFTNNSTGRTLVCSLYFNGFFQDNQSANMTANGLQNITFTGLIMAGQYLVSCYAYDSNATSASASAYANYWRMTDCLIPAQNITTNKTTNITYVYAPLNIGTPYIDVKTTIGILLLGLAIFGMYHYINEMWKIRKTQDRF